MATIFRKLLARSGLSSKLAKSKLVPGEFAVTTDDNKAYICTSAGNTQQIATHEQLANILNSSSDAYQAMQTLIETLEDNPSQLATILSAINTLTSGLAEANSDISTNSGAIAQNANAITTINNNLTNVNYALNPGGIDGTCNFNFIIVPGRYTGVGYPSNMTGLPSGFYSGAQVCYFELIVKLISDDYLFQELTIYNAVSYGAYKYLRKGSKSLAWAGWVKLSN